MGNNLQVDVISAAILQALGDNSPGAIIFALDRAYRYVYFNTRHAAVMKVIWGEEIAEGISMLDVIRSPADREKAKCNFDRSPARQSRGR